MPFDPAIAAVLGGDAAVAEVGEDAIIAAVIAALDSPPLEMRQADFEKRDRRRIDPALVTRAAVLVGLILLSFLLISLITILRYEWAAKGLDDASLALARTEVPTAQDAREAEALLTAKLAARGDPTYAFSGRLAALYAALQVAPDVSVTRLSRESDGTIALSLTAPSTDAANRAIVAIQQAGFALEPLVSQMVGGKQQAEIRVKPS
jgi:general secretion pathway protein L